MANRPSSAHQGPLPAGAMLYLLMDMSEVDPTAEALSSYLRSLTGKELTDSEPDTLLRAFREAGGRVFLPAIAASARTSEMEANRG